MASTGFEPMTSVIPVQCSTNRAVKPHIGREVNPQSPHLPWKVKWCEAYMKQFIHLNCGRRSKWRLIIVLNFRILATGKKIGRASHRYCGGHGFESHWTLDLFRLLLSNCLDWKIYCNDQSSLWSTPAVQVYELFHICFTSLHFSWEVWTQWVDLASDVWLHGLVGRASHWYCGAHGFESRWSLDFFRLFLSNDQSSL